MQHQSQVAQPLRRKRVLSTLVAGAVIGLAGTARASGSLYQQSSFSGTNLAWSYTMGYRFTPNRPITVTQLGGAFWGTKNVYLYDDVTGQILASNWMAGGGTLYPYNPITPVQLAPGHPYSVAVALGGSGGNYGFVPMPMSLPDATVNASCFLSNPGTTSNGDPCTAGIQSTTTMYGAADLLYWLPPAITGQPSSMAVTAGQPATFVVYDTTTCGVINTQWQLNGVNLSDGGVYNGTHSGMLSISSAGAPQAGSYRAVVSCANGGGVSYSRPAVLTVRANAAVMIVPPIIRSLTATACTGAGCTIAWSVTGATTMTLTPAGGAPVGVTGSQVVVYPPVSTLYTLTATNGAGTYSQNVLVPIGNPTVTVDGCRTIDMPGRYLVTRSFGSTSTTTPCLDVHDNHDIYIECAAGVEVSGISGDTAAGGPPPASGAIRIKNVNNFAIRNCTFRDAGGTGPYVASIVDSSLGVVSNTTIGSPALTTKRAGAHVGQSHYVTFASDTIYNELHLRDATGIAVVGTTITNVFPGSYNPSTGDHRYTGANLSQDNDTDESGLQVVGCAFDGGATGARIAGTQIFAGADDGTYLKGSHQLYAYNVMRNYYDAAIESVFPTDGLTVYQNQLFNAGYGALDWNREGDLSGCMLAGNYIDSSGWPEVNDGIDIAVAAADGATPRFQYNNVSDNRIVNGAHSRASQFITIGSWLVGQNLFYGNHFNENSYPGITAPVFTEPYRADFLTDLGGNLCAHPNPADYPLVCH